jgi:hypothetical protein
MKTLQDKAERFDKIQNDAMILTQSINNKLYEIVETLAT